MFALAALLSLHLSSPAVALAPARTETPDGGTQKKKKKKKEPGDESKEEELHAVRFVVPGDASAT
jgi:ribosomal protein L12E/L44/L45/RPP1/RPP2